MIASEVASMMYALAIMSFDAKYGLSYQMDANAHARSNPFFESTMLLWYAHSRVLSAYNKVKFSDFDQLNRNQLAIYFEMMKGHPNSKQLVEEILEGPVPVIEACSDASQSPFHSRIANSLTAILDEINPDKFSIVNEFHGLGGFFPVDIAVFDGSKPISFIEVDGAFHYTSNNYGFKLLKRVDLLKEHLYRLQFPQVPIHRVTMTMTRKYGVKQVTYDLAMGILRSAGIDVSMLDVE